MPYSIPSDCTALERQVAYPIPSAGDGTGKPETSIPDRSDKRVHHHSVRNRHGRHAEPGIGANRLNGRARPGSSPDGGITAADSGNVQTISKTAVTVSKLVKADIAITTQDGDTVILNASSAFEATFAAYNQSGRIDATSYAVSAAGTSFNASGEFSLSVEGQLDKEELHHIDAAVRQVDKIMRQLSSGNLEQALKRASKLHKLDSLSGLEAVLETTNSISVTQQSEAAVTGYPPTPESQQPAEAA